MHAPCETISTPTGGPSSLAALDLAALHPRNGAKFSPNLYAYLSKSRHAAVQSRLRVFADTSHELWLGYQFDGDFIGTRMNRVLLVGAKAEEFSFSNLGELRELAEFWAEYAKDGRCAIDVRHVRHFVNDESRWAVTGATRACQWCHHCSQTLHQWTETKTVERKQWR